MFIQGVKASLDLFFLYPLSSKLLVFVFKFFNFTTTLIAAAYQGVFGENWKNFPKHPLKCGRKEKKFIFSLSSHTLLGSYPSSNEKSRSKPEAANKN
ncbi:MAG: hypothetical protein IPN76_27745 [Saprospiraceae bacterium]|nr:hypothetical protein [Saprospiraceae bacterium]